MNNEEVKALLWEAADQMQDQEENSLAWKLRQLAHQFVQKDGFGPPSPQGRLWQSLDGADKEDPILLYHRDMAAGGTIIQHWMFRGRDLLSLARTTLQELRDYHDLNDSMRIEVFLDEELDQDEPPIESLDSIEPEVEVDDDEKNVCPYCGDEMCVGDCDEAGYDGP